MRTLPSPSSLPWLETGFAVSPDATRAITLVAPRGHEFAATRLAPQRQGRPSSNSKNYTTVPNSRGADLAWQAEVMAAFRQVPELRYVTNAIARAASICPVVPDGADKRGPESPQTSKTRPSTPENAIPSSLVFRAAQLLTLVGEYFLVSRRRTDGANEIAVLSPTEIKRSSLFWELPAPWGVWYPKSVATQQDIRLTRVHQPAPECWERSDSAPASALPVLRELIGLTMAISSTIDSRLAGAGVLVYPMGAEVGAPPGDSSGQYDNDLPLGDALMQAMIDPIADRSVAAARVPVTVGVPDEYAGKGAVEHITMSVPLDAQIPELIDKCIRRLAMGMDAPPEVLLGMQNTASLGAAWLVSDDRIRTHITPLLELIAAGFAVHLEKDYTFDISPLQVHPNLAPEAKDAYDRGAISQSSYRNAIGFADADAPPDPKGDIDAAAWHELHIMLKNSPSLAQTPGIPAVLAQLKAALRGETPDNAIYPGKDLEVSEDETPRAEGAPIPDRSEPRNAPPAASPRGQQPRSEGAPNRGRAGEPRQRPGVGT